MSSKELPLPTSDTHLTLDQRCQPIELILADVDGVLTDGTIQLDNQGIEAKQFHIRDGMGIKLWQKAGYRFGLITLRSSHVVQARATELGIDIIRQGNADKLSTAREVLAELRLEPRQVCYIGDDLPDLPVYQTVGLAVAVADGVAELRQAAHFVSQTNGGRGAVRETIEMILKAQRRWADVIQNYTEGSRG